MFDYIGDQVEFRWAGEDEFFVAPPEYYVVWDPDGEFVRACNLYVIPAKASGEDWRGESERAKAYLADDDLEHYEIELPKGKWREIGTIDLIRYRRSIELGSFQHPYKVPVPLFESTGKTPSWRVYLPDGCVIDDRGFVWP